MILAPSILSADFAALGDSVEKIKKADLIHVDVMDGHFVPNISFGAGVMKSLNGKTKLPYDVHLMIENPDFYIKDFVTDNTKYITVHREACKHLDRTIDLIKSFGVKAGVAINPATSVLSIKDILHKVDLILVMSVNPGFGGQKFIDYTLSKVEELSLLRKNKELQYSIEVDGGVNLDNAKKILEAGADVLVVGSAIFNSDSVSDTVEQFTNIEIL